ncbi:hypothetical protein [Aquibaculum arenosum]|uniref:Abi-like protein n=1 Tax=Aquibaculum arenosum TaxID=3032591 RepID=A0ABT5YNR4_9PROT|nr:hypothetical protein [Fodinicurvata sp. CAU 1616]MDF2096524.1 hypothetical protein [Fodinicurvata sp. CAU 1616]
MAAIKLYVHNTILSEGFYTPLQGLEIALRNALHAQFSNRFGADWYDAAIKDIRHPQTTMIARAKTTLRRDRKPITPSGMVAELSFGFWVGLLGPDYEVPLWRRCCRHAFPYRPLHHERKQVLGALNSVRRLRNRVAHHEPILHRNLETDHQTIINAASWICPHTAEWIRAHSRLPGLLGKRTTAPI